jgi:hypothetical protein
MISLFEYLIGLHLASRGVCNLHFICFLAVAEATGREGVPKT